MTLMLVSKNGQHGSAPGNPLGAGRAAVVYGGGMPVYRHGFWVPYPVDGFPPDQLTGRSFLATYEHHQAGINATQWRIRRGHRLDTSQDVFPVTTGEIKVIGGNRSLCIAPDRFTRDSVIWVIDPTVPGNEEALGAGGDSGALGAEKQASMKRSFELNHAAGFARGIKGLRGAWRGKQVIVLGNGPSLPENVKSLRRFKGVIILGVNRASDYVDPALLDALVIVDHLLDVRHFREPERARAVPLVFAETTACTEFVEFLGRDKVTWFSPRVVPPGREWQLSVREETGWIPVEMSVLNAAANLAYYQGAESVIFLGADHCYHPVGEPVPWPAPRLRNRGDFAVGCTVCGDVTAESHGPAVPLQVEGHDAVLRTQGRDHPVLRYAGRPQPYNQELFTAWDMSGHAVVTDALVELPALQLCGWARFQRIAAHEGRRFIRCVNATGRGLMFDPSQEGGMMQVDFAAFAERFLEAA